MRVYIDLSCFNRPFDDQGQERIRLETQAVLAILSRIVDGTDTLVWSWVLTFENDKHPKRDRREEIGMWKARAERTVGLSQPIIEHAGQFISQGIQVLDAAHLASAEEAGADIFVTCDDAVVRRAPRLSLTLRVLNPVAYLSEVEAHG